MNEPRFTTEEVDELLVNPNVQSCSEYSITYSQHFKECAVLLYEQGLTSKEIFKQAGLDLEVIGQDHPKDCLKRWRKIVREKGVGGLAESRGENGKGGGSKTKDVSDVDKIEYLETQIAYLKAENAFLAKLRAKRRE